MKTPIALNTHSEQSSTLADIKPILAEVLRRLQEKFGERLVSVILYGSYARSEAENGSDIDLLVVVSELPYEWRDIFAIEDELIRIGFDLGKRLDIHLVEPQAVSYSVTSAAPFILEVYDAHDIVFDTIGFFAAEMTRFREIMLERGISKIERGVWRVPSYAY